MPVVVRHACVHVLRVVASAPASFLRKKHCSRPGLVILLRKVTMLARTCTLITCLCNTAGDPPSLLVSTARARSLVSARLARSVLLMLARSRQ